MRHRKRTVESTISAGISFTLTLAGIGLSGCLAEEAQSVDEAEIYGGIADSDYKFPWVVDLCQGINNGPACLAGTAPKCQGVLLTPTNVTPQWVMTSGNCVGQFGSATVLYKRTTSTGGTIYDYQNTYSMSLTDHVNLLKATTPLFDPNNLLVPAELPYGPGFVGQVGSVASGRPSSTTFGISSPSITSTPDPYSFTATAPSSSLCSTDKGAGLIMQGANKNFVVGVADVISGTCNANNVPWTGIQVYPYVSWIRSTTGIPAPPAPGPMSDVVWRHTNGSVTIWHMNQSAHTDTFPGTNPGDNTKQIQGFGDITGDGQTDILWRNPTTGALQLWWMTNGNLSATTTPTYWGGSAPSTDWTILGVGKFDNTGAADILFRAPSTTQIGIWKMSGGALSADVYPGTISNSYTFSGIADFNGDGTSDILWRHTNGTVLIWLMSNGAILSQASPGAATTDFVIAGTGDFDGDGKADILWRHAATGTLPIWFMNGTTLLDGTKSAGTVGNEWAITFMGDYNGDGKSDIFWRATDGSNAIWYMFGAFNWARGYPNAVDNTFAIKGVAQFN